MKNVLILTQFFIFTSIFATEYEYLNGLESSTYDGNSLFVDSDNLPIMISYPIGAEYHVNKWNGTEWFRLDSLGLDISTLDSYFDIIPGTNKIVCAYWLPDNTIHSYILEDGYWNLLADPISLSGVQDLKVSTDIDGEHKIVVLHNDGAYNTSVYKLNTSTNVFDLLNTTSSMLFSNSSVVDNYTAMDFEVSVMKSTGGNAVQIFNGTNWVALSGFFTPTQNDLFIDQSLGFAYVYYKAASTGAPGITNVLKVNLNTFASSTYLLENASIIGGDTISGATSTFLIRQEPISGMPVITARPKIWTSPTEYTIHPEIYIFNGTDWQSYNLEDIIYDDIEEIEFGSDGTLYGRPAVGLNNKVFKVAPITLGQEELTPQNQIIHQTTPTAHIFNLSTTNTTLKVYDLNGKVVLSGANAAQHTISNESLPAGMYVAELKTEDGAVHRNKFVVTK